MSSHTQSIQSLMQELSRLPGIGAPLDATAEMVNVDGRWYGKQMMEKLKEKAAAAATDTVAAPAPSAPAAPQAAPKG